MEDKIPYRRPPRKTRQFRRLHEPAGSSGRAVDRSAPRPGGPALLVAETVVLVLMIAGCGAPALSLGELPATANPAGRAAWAMVNELYVRVHATPSADAAIVQLLRRGDVGPVLGKTAYRERVAGEMGYWYRLEHRGLEGWVFERRIQLFPTRDLARSAAAAETTATRTAPGAATTATGAAAGNYERD